MTDLTRFDVAQFDTYDIALAEMKRGKKTTHWMWFIFPQLRALGRSHRAKYYGIADLDEASAYLSDPDLGPRLVEVAQTVLEYPDLSAKRIVGEIDALKLRSSATLFREAAQDPETRAVFQAILTTFYGGEPCTATLEQLSRVA